MFERKDRFFPIPVSGQSGTRRWRTSDHRTYDTRQQAERAQAELGTVVAANSNPHDLEVQMFGLAMYALVACLIGVVGIVGWQCLAWLRSGAWPVLAISDLTGPAHLGWVGADRLLQGALGTPLSLALVIAAVALGFAATWGDRPAARNATADPRS